MLWFLAEIDTGNAIVDNLWMQYGAIGLVIVLLGLAVIYLLRENKEERKLNRELSERLLEQAESTSQRAIQPLEKFTDWIGDLYERSIRQER